MVLIHQPATTTIVQSCMLTTAAGFMYTGFLNNEKIQTSRKTMWAVDEKLIFNKCWPKTIIVSVLECYNVIEGLRSKVVYSKMKYRKLHELYKSKIKNMHTL